MSLTTANSPPGLERLNYSAHRIRGSKFQNYTHTPKMKLQSDPQKTMSFEYVYYCQHIATTQNNHTKLNNESINIKQQKVMPSFSQQPCHFPLKKIPTKRQSIFTYIIHITT